MHGYIGLGLGITKGKDGKVKSGVAWYIGIEARSGWQSGFVYERDNVYGYLVYSSTTFSRSTLVQY